MLVMLKYALSPQPTGLGQTPAPARAANDNVPLGYNCHLHLATNSANNLETESLSLDGRGYDLSYGYNALGQITSRTLPGGRVLSIDRDGLGRATGISGGGTNYASGIGYHASGAINAMNYGNGQALSVGFNARLQPAHILSQFGANKALDLSYTYTARGKVETITNGAISGDNRTYWYDILGRMRGANGPWGAGRYFYDALGNMRKTIEAGSICEMSYDGKNRLTSYTDTGGPDKTIGYDNRGNINWLGGQFFYYDMSNQPITVLWEAAGTYRYDGHKRRVKSLVDGKTIYNIYDASGTLVQIDNVTDGEVTDYIRAGGKSIARIVTSGGVDAVTYLHNDHLGSAATGTSANGLVSWREQYTPFGRSLNSPLSNNDRDGFTGYIKDSATGLTYMQARYYDPVIGRFLSIDPVGFMDTGNPVHFNRYAYANNDPINMLDPDGRMAKGGKKRPLSPGALEKARSDVEKYKGDRSAAGKSKYNKAIKKLEFQEKLDGKRNAQKRKTEFKKTKSLSKKMIKGGGLGLALSLMDDEVDALMDEADEALSEPQELVQTITGCTGACDEWANGTTRIITDPENNKPSGTGSGGAGGGSTSGNSAATSSSSGSSSSSSGGCGGTRIGNSGSNSIC